MDTLGNVYVAAYGNDVVQKISPGGAIQGFSGPFTNLSPYAVAVDASFNVYVGVQSVVQHAGSLMVKLADGTTPLVSSYNIYDNITGIALDGHGLAYVAQTAGRDGLVVVVNLTFGWYKSIDFASPFNPSALAYAYNSIGIIYFTDTYSDKVTVQYLNGVTSAAHHRWASASTRPRVWLLIGLGMCT